MKASDPPWRSARLSAGENVALIELDSYEMLSMVVVPYVLGESVPFVLSALTALPTVTGSKNASCIVRAGAVTST